jgi:hypothetical protein
MNQWDCTRLDVEYAMTYTLWLDIKIICYHFLHLLTNGQRNEEQKWLLRHLRAMEKNIAIFSKDKERIFSAAAH